MRRLAICTALALTAMTAVSWAVVPKHDTYEGKTGQNKSVFVKVNDKGRVKAFLIEYKAKCGSAYSPYSGVVQDNDKKGDRITQQNGVFSGTAKKNEDVGAYVGHVTLTYSGKFTTATAANGNATIKVKVTRNGDQVTHCSKTTTWHVSA